MTKHVSTSDVENIMLSIVEDLAQTSTSRPRPTNGRRSRAQVRDLRDLMTEILSREHPMTCRQMFYRLVSEGVIEKSESEYKSTVVRLLGAMRREGQIEFAWIADNTRWMRKPPSYGSLEDMLRRTAETYRRSLWDDQPVYVEVWLEKDALAGVLYEETARYDVPLMVTRGYSSLSFLHSAAEAIQAQEKPAFLYYLGDHDPSGVHIPIKTCETLRELAPDAEINFEVIAVTADQIEEFRLPTRPTKKSDSRAKHFEGESVEVDAIPPQALRLLVRDCIEAHIDRDLLRATARIENEERATLARIAGLEVAP